MIEGGLIFNGKPRKEKNPGEEGGEVMKGSIGLRLF